MSEESKTGVFMAIAMALLVIAWISQPESPKDNPEGAGESLFAEFTDSQKVAKIEILQFDEEKGDFSKILVERDKNNIWKIETLGGYPADETTQLQNAVTLLFDRKKLSVESQERGRHSYYGVIKPEENVVKLGDQGVGRLVRYLDEEDKPLAELIIGKEVNNENGQSSGSGDGELFYVRIPGSETVLTTRIENDSAITTDFTDWIETSLFNRAGWSFSSGSLEEITIGGLLSQSITGRIATNEFRFIQSQDESPKWVNNGPKFATHEELNTNTIDTLAGVFGSVKIQNVVRQPPSLTQLKLEALATNVNVLSAMPEGINQSDAQALVDVLGSNGFLGQIGRDIIWPHGHLLLGMDDGLEIIIRYGEKPRAEDNSPRGKYLLARARFKERLIEKPELPESAEGNKTGSNLGKLKGAIARVTPEHQKKLEEYEKNVEKGKRAANALDEKLAGWFFIISDEDYNKMRLQETSEPVRAQLVKNRTISASHILVKHDDADDETKRTREEARKRIDEARVQAVAKGAQFAKIVTTYSDDNATRANGGDIGSFDLPAIRNRFGFKFATAAFDLDVNGTSPVIDGDNGFHIIRRIK